MRLSRFGEAIIHVDLTTGRCERRPAPPDWVRKFIGARGLGVRYVLENGPEVDAFSPDNVLGQLPLIVEQLIPQSRIASDHFGHQIPHRRALG